MKPLSRTPIGIARNHLSVTDAVAVAVCWLVRINLSVVIIALPASDASFTCPLRVDNCVNSRVLLLVLFIASVAIYISRRPSPRSFLECRQCWRRGLAGSSTLCRDSRVLGSWRHRLALAIVFVRLGLFLGGCWRRSYSCLRSLGVLLRDFGFDRNKWLCGFLRFGYGLWPCAWLSSGLGRTGRGSVRLI